MKPSIRLQTTRRQFLAAGAALSVAAMQPVAGARADGVEPLRVGLLGCGAGGTAVMASGVTEMTFVAVAGGAGARGLAARHQVEEISVEALIARRDVDAVIVATPDRWRVDHASAALAAGKHVFVLPPLALRGEDGARLAAQARSAGRLLRVGLPQGEAERWRAVAVVERPTWIQASARVAEHGPAWMGSREESWGLAARKIYDMLHGLHTHCDLGAPISATALGGVFGGATAGAPDALTVTVRYDGGATVVLSAGRHVAAESMLMRGRDDVVEMDLGGDMGLASDLTEFARAAKGQAEDDARLDAAVRAQAVMSAALERWAAWA